MPAWFGWYRGSKPSITFQIAGTQGHPAEVAATIDTGFSGFMMISASEAAPHALESVGSTFATMADGSRALLDTSLATIGFAGRSRRGVAVVPSGECECLVGIAFLRKFDLGLMLNGTQIALVDEDEFQGTLQRLQSGEETR